jgi:hypothetical protein
MRMSMTDPNDPNQETQPLRIGLRVRGTYFGVPFVGQVVHAVPDTNQFIVVADPPIQVFGSLRDALPFSEDAAQRGKVTIISE